MPKSQEITKRTRSERLSVVNETKLKLCEHNLEQDPASKVLWAIMDQYVETGDPVNTNLFLKHRYDIERKFIVQLHNNKRFKDVVLIRAMTPDEIEINNKNASSRTKTINSTTVKSNVSMPVGVTGGWNNKSYIEGSRAEDESDSEEECPELEMAPQEKDQE